MEDGAKGREKHAKVVVSHSLEPRESTREQVSVAGICESSSKGPTQNKRFKLWRRGKNGIVPFAMEIFLLDLDAAHFLVGDLSPH